MNFSIEIANWRGRIDRKIIPYMMFENPRSISIINGAGGAVYHNIIPDEPTHARFKLELPTVIYLEKILYFHKYYEYYSLISLEIFIPFIVTTFEY